MADPRFSALRSDPRYRLPSRKQSRTAVDPRFKGAFTDPDFHRKASVDRYGRKVKPESGKKQLKKLYRLEKDEKTYASSRKQSTRDASSSEEDSDHNEDEPLVEKNDPAREGGFSDSSSNEESSSGEDSEGEAEETASQEQTAEVPSGDVTHRLAAVNMDWDNLRATDIMASASRFVPASGSIESVTIYPSEFGRERMEQEELRGPPQEIFASSKRRPKKGEETFSSEEESDEDDEKIKRRLQRDQLNDGSEFDMPKLRQYQLERLRYYYAVVTCDSKATAKAIYDALDKSEYHNTSNYFDLRFIPDETSFLEDLPRESCNNVPAGYRPNQFRTGALTHSNVRLTWDDEDPVRKEVQRRAFSRAEMDENDLQAYIASDASDSDAESVSAVKDRKVKTRALFGLSEQTSAPLSKKNNKDEVVGDIQITFTPGLSGGNDSKGVFENEPQDEESTRERYIRKERDRKLKRKEKMKAAKTGTNLPGDVEDAVADVAPEIEDKGFEDPFFTDPATAAATEKKAKKAEKQKKLAAQAAEDNEAAARRAELELLMADDQADNLKHFDMREIEKAEKDARRKHKRMKNKVSEEVNDTFQIETQDPRFKSLYESHEYAIDPSNPRFKKTEANKALLEEGRKKRKREEI